MARPRKNPGTETNIGTTEITEPGTGAAPKKRAPGRPKGAGGKGGTPEINSQLLAMHERAVRAETNLANIRELLRAR